MSMFETPWPKRLGRFARRHLWLILFVAFMAASVWMLVGCASTRIDPASNSAKVETERTPATKTTRITIGGAAVQTEAK